MPIKSYRGCWPILAVLCSLLLGCSRPISDELPSTGGDAATRNSITRAEPDGRSVEEDAISAILALVENGDERKNVLTLNDDGHVVRADLSGMAAVNDDTILPVAALPQLEELSLQRCGITDQAFVCFARMPNLKRIRVVQTVVSDSGLEHLKGRRNLELLDLHECSRVSDAGVEHLSGLTNLKELRLWGPQITNASIKHLQGLSSLRVLSLQDCSIDDAGLEHLSGLTALRDLTLFRTFVGDEGMRHVGKLTQLRRLSLRATVVGSEGLVHLKPLRNLQRLDLSETIVGNEGLAHIKGLPKLVDLNLWATRVGDEGMLHLAEIAALERLNLENVGFPRDGVSLTSQGVKHLATLQNLEWLNLGKTDVCDEGIVAIGKLPRLASLHVNACQDVTSEGIASLRTTRPAIDIQQ
jgi:Leucine-rich repeat (LRR) protein